MVGWIRPSLSATNPYNAFAMHLALGAKEAIWGISWVLECWQWKTRCLARKTTTLILMLMLICLATESAWCQQTAFKLNLIHLLSSRGSRQCILLAEKRPCNDYRIRQSVAKIQVWWILFMCCLIICLFFSLFLWCQPCPWVHTVLVTCLHSSLSPSLRKVVEVVETGNFGKRAWWSWCSKCSCWSCWSKYSRRLFLDKVTLVMVSRVSWVARHQPGSLDRHWSTSWGISGSADLCCQHLDSFI